MSKHETAFNMVKNLFIEYNNIDDSIKRCEEFKDHINDLLGYLNDNFPLNDIDHDIEIKNIKDMIYNGNSISNGLFADYEKMSNAVFVLSIMRHFLRDGRIDFRQIDIQIGKLSNWKIYFKNYGSLVMDTTKSQG